MVLSIYLYIVFLVFKTLCIYQHPVYASAKEIENITKQMSDENKRIENWNALMNQKGKDSLWYPRGDKQKLSALSSLWQDYYDCSIRSLHKLTHHGQVPSTMLMVYTGAVARLPCSVCAPPDQTNLLVWMYAELLPSNKTFKVIQYGERLVLEHNHLHIYNTKFEDAGMYRCQIGDSTSLAVLEVVDTEEKYSVVKPPTSRGPYESPPTTLNTDITVFSAWSPWSECSVCGKVGRRRRYGLCYVKLESRQRKRRVNQNDDDEEDNIINLDNDAIELFETFPEGIPCRSRFLPSNLKHVSAIKQRRSEIMIAMCKVPCEAIIFKLRSSKGKVLEIANNSAGIFSLHQILPKQPPLPARDTIFAVFGQKITIRCPGTTLSDVPITWRFGTKPMVPRDVDKASGGRMYINSRDHVVITKVLYRDANVYSCWQRSRLAGAVQLLVGGQGLSPRTVRLALAMLAAVALLGAERACRGLQRRSNYVSGS